MARSAQDIRLKVSGVAVAFTDEACSDTGDHARYRITNAAKRVWDPQAAVTVEIGGVAAAEPYTINRLAGTVTFATPDAGRGAVTVSGSYLPLSAAAKGKAVTLTASATNGEATTFDDDDVVREQLDRDFSASVTRLEVDEYFRDALEAGDVLVLEYSPDRGSSVALRAWVLVTKDGMTAARGAFQEETVEFEGSADADGRSVTFQI